MHDDVEAERLADALTKAGIEWDEAHQEAAGSRENAARLQGQVEGMTAQQGELMKAIAARTEREPRDGRAPASPPLGLKRADRAGIPSRSVGRRRG